MGYFLFLLLNFTLFVRPTDFTAELPKIYEPLIIACCIASLPGILEQVLLRFRETRPLTLGMLAMWMICCVSALMQPDSSSVEDSFVIFFKVVVYYVLFVAVVNTPGRLRGMLLCLGFSVTVLASISVLRYHELIDLAPPPMVMSADPLNPLEQKTIDLSKGYIDDDVDVGNADSDKVRRLRGTGLFGDPNDLCLALVFGVLLCFYGICEPDLGILRFGCVLPLGLFLYALHLTYSRGGLLGLLAGSAVLFAFRYGWRRAVFLGIVLAPLLLVMFGGRMTSMSATEGTGQSRVQLWRDAMALLKEHPLFGVGMNRFMSYTGLLAHNSFVHSFAELGIMGGTVFLGLFCYAFWALFQARRHIILDPQLERFLPFLMAILVGFSSGIFSLSRGYDVPTYTMLALPAAYLNVVPAYPPLASVSSPGRLVLTIGAISFVFVICMHITVRLLAT